MRSTITGRLRCSNFCNFRSKTVFLKLLSCHYRYMKSPLNLSLVLFLAFGAWSSIDASDVTPQTEVYGTASDGTVLHWVVYQPSTPGPWPTVLVIHGGGFIDGSPDSSSE